MHIEVFPDETNVAAAAARLIAAAAREAVATRGRFLMAVSGGKTPWAMLRDLASEDVPWSQFHVFQVDERLAADGDPESEDNEDDDFEDDCSSSHSSSKDVELIREFRKQAWEPTQKVAVLLLIGSLRRRPQDAEKELRARLKETTKAVLRLSGNEKLQQHNTVRVSDGGK
jgi:hypothetical protein